MIRFIDIRNQGTGERFAFYSTVVDKFLEFDGEQAWTNWNEFEAAFINEHHNQLLEIDERERERYKGLCPEWVFNDEEDDIEGFYT